MVLLPAAACRAAEHLAEYVAEIKTLRTAESAKTACAESALFKGGVSVLVIGGALLRIGQDFVSLLDFFEFFFGSGIARIAVGMVFHRHFAIGFFDFVIACCAGNAQCGVVVLVAHVGFCK